MSETELYETELRPTPIPLHEEAKIGPASLRHRADILDRLLPEVFGQLRVYATVIEFCFFDEPARIAALNRLGGLLIELGAANEAMFRTAFMAGEA